MVAAGRPFCARAETLDAVVASIGNQAITSSDVAQEYRFERFLDGAWPPPAPNAAALAAAREHLTYQILLTREENPGLPTGRRARKPPPSAWPICAASIMARRNLRSRSRTWA